MIERYCRYKRICRKAVKAITAVGAGTLTLIGAVVAAVSAERIAFRKRRHVENKSRYGEYQKTNVEILTNVGEVHCLLYFSGIRWFIGLLSSNIGENPILAIREFVGGKFCTPLFQCASVTNVLGRPFDPSASLRAGMAQDKRPRLPIVL